MPQLSQLFNNYCYYFITKTVACPAAEKSGGLPRYWGGDPLTNPRLLAYGCTAVLLDPAGISFGVCRLNQGKSAGAVEGKQA
jgi:hypothetical protein